MKKALKMILTVFFIVILIISTSVQAFANENDAVDENVDGDSTQITYDEQADKLFKSLPQETQDVLSELGLAGTKSIKLNELSFSKILSLIANAATSQSVSPFASMATVIAIMILYAVLESYKDSLKLNTMQEVLAVVTTLCISAALLFPSVEIINYASKTIENASNFMLMYIPVAVGIMAYSGQGISGSSYYTLMVFACQGITQISSRIVVPFLNIFLGISVTGSLTSKVNLSPLCEMLSKVTKWVLAFIMTVFSGFLTFKTIIATSLDSISTRAIRFTLSSFVPIVGTALSEAYKTVQSSVKMLKSGMGVFVIFAIAVVFFPIIIKCLVWLLSVNVCKTFGEIVELKTPCKLLGSISSVISTIIAILICIMSVYVISTALVMMLGGGGQ